MTIDEVAKAAGVSKATVSFVINGKKGVSRETAVKVRKVTKLSLQIIRRMCQMGR